jgi:hypothetical protein
LPIEKEAQEVARQHRLDLGAQAFDRVAVNAGEQPAIAPLNRDAAVGLEVAAHRRAFGFQGKQRRIDVGQLHAQRGGERASVGRTETFEATAHDFAHRFAAIPFLHARRRHGDVGLEGGFRENGFQQRQAFGR